ncbi:hypothetical protein [Acidocella sp. KAb 2-4]|uniref:hypothetical protein n=1 Tax=Acidocella sp. KAb 2-4 TaxID=2885158 RepID=UPI001D08619B|nr:hypothetical protein [Acidocella sp. KAb 2-4]MCB5944120.1 hypothetical protein [Acidocella sp. KAb 2-4]
MDGDVTDKVGRRIGLRRVGIVDQLRLFKALGPELSENRAYYGLAKLAASVAMIDDVPVPFPANEAGIEAALERLGEDGVEAVGAYLTAEAGRDVVAEAGN